MIVISWYILKVLIVSGILTGYYFVALKDKVFHRWNRFYLLLTVCLSLLLPFVSINIFSVAAEQGNIIKALQTITMQDEIVIEMGRKSAMSANMLLMYGYLLISLFFVARLISSFIQIENIRKRYPNAKVNGINFINTDEKGTPFSFFNDIFWNRSIDLHTTPGQQIFNHEVAHITEKHTYDKIFMNIILLFFWINPFFWIIRKELNMIHEFIADKMALEDGDTKAFAEMILSSVFTRQQFAITNHFFYSPIKRRLLMLTKNKHTKVNYISRLLVLPLAAIVFVGISCKVKTDTESQMAPDEIVATAPLNDDNNLVDTSGSAVYYNNKKITGLAVATPDGKSAYIKLTYEDGSTENLSMETATKAGLPIPPPPPPPPPPPTSTMFNGKEIKSAVKAKGNTVIIKYTDDSKETITLDQAKEANLNVVEPPPPPTATVLYVAPSLKMDSEVQDEDISQQESSSQDKIFTKVEQEASFPGGVQKWSGYISKAITAEMDKFDKNDNGTCVVKFIVDSDGNVSEVEATTMKGTQLAKVTIDAIRKGPKWTPAMNNNKPVSAYRLQPITLSGVGK